MSTIRGIVAGTIVTLVVATLGVVGMQMFFEGNWPLWLVALVLLGSPLLGGSMADWLAWADDRRPGAISGLAAGIIWLVALAVVSGMSPRILIAGIVAVPVWTLGGIVGAMWSRRWRVSQAPYY